MSLRYKNIFRKNIFSRSKAILLLLLIFVSSIITLPILQSTNVGATNLYTGLGDDDVQIRSYLYYQAIKECFSKTTLSAPANDWGINYDDIDSGKWFDINNPIHNATGLGSYLVGGTGTSPSPSQEGDAWCGRDADKVVLPALKIWGIGAAELLCNIGFTRKNVLAKQTIDECINDQNNLALITNLTYDERVAEFERYMKESVYYNENPNALHAWQFFLLFRTTLQNSNCIPEINSRPPGEDKIDGWDDPLGRVYYPVKWVNEKGDLWENTKDGSNDGTYYLGTSREKNDYIWTMASDDNPRKCSALVSDMNGYADEYADWLKKKLAQNSTYTAPVVNNQTGTGGSGPATCAIDGIGWLICPVVRFLGHIADGAFRFLANNFLQTSPGIFTNTNGTLYNAWSAMRNVANIAFVIAFLVIIFSQLTSVGITNYGIKKLLPRLIIAAILVNLSYFICQIAVDISNILGWTLQNFFETLTSNIQTSLKLAPTIGQGDANVFTGIASGVILLSLGGALAYAALSAFIPVVLAAIVGLVMILAILIARQALIILLIVISPVAFVAFLLPNTLSWFTKWQKAFVAMLMLFPIVGLVYGVSRLASGILTEVTQAGNNNSWFTEIAAAAVAVLPLFVVPGLLKKALDGVGSIGGKISGLGGKWGGAAGDRFKNSAYNKYREGRKADERARIATGNYGGRNKINQLRSKLNRRFNRSSFANKLTGGYGAQLDLAAQAQNRKDMQDTMGMFNNDDGLISAWADTGGNVDKIKTWVNPVTGKGLLNSQQEQFKLMVNAGYQRKSNSFIAAAQYLSENGKGNATTIRSALSNATKAGASDIDTSVALEGAKAAYRKSGRGDVLAELDNKTPVVAWGQISPSSVHREALSSLSGSTGYSDFLQSSAENTRSALVGYDQMEQRARVIAEKLIVDAAQAHATASVPVGGTPIVISNIQEAKAHFGVR